MVSPLPPECEQLLITGYVLGNLSEVEAILFEELVGENPDLKIEIAKIQSALEIAYFPPEVTPPPSLRDRVLTAADRVKNRQEVDTNSNINIVESSKVNRVFSWSKLLGIIAFLSIFGLGIVNYNLRESLRIARMEINESQDKVYLLGDNKNIKAATAKVVVNPNVLKGSLSVNNLAPLPQDKVYVLWTVVGKDAPFTTDDKGAILTTVFEVNSDGNFLGKINLPQPYMKENNVKKLAITMEDKSNPQAHTGSIIISAQ